MFKKTFSLNMTRIRLIISNSQLIMLNCIETRFLLFLRTLADLLIPITFSSWLFLNLKQRTDYPNLCCCMIF